MIGMVAIASSLSASLNQTGAASAAPAGSRPAPASNAAPTNRTGSVTLGQTGASPVYTLAQLSPSYAWQRASSDAISSHLAGNVLTTSLGSRFAGLGAAMLERFRTDASDYSQSVIAVGPNAAAGEASGTSDIGDSRFQAPATNEVGLTLNLRSGATVTVTLGSDRDRLAVRVAVTDGTLTAADREALAGLSSAFQTALDALGEVPPRLDLGNLLDTDPKVIASVNLHATIDAGQNKTQSIDFAADDRQRTVTVRGPAGDIDVKVDMANAATLGSAAQQASAIQHYLRQFDAAKSRGQADPALMAMFKDAFATLHGHRDGSGASGAGGIRAAGSNIQLSVADRGMMTGLGDFDASITQAAVASNPMRSDEVDTFAYQASQHTQIMGSSSDDRNVHQRQTSKLDASFHRSLFNDTPLMLSESRYSQNYIYEQIHDTASSDMRLAYADGALVEATVTQAADQSRRVQKYELGHLESDVTDPSSKSRTFDVLGMIQEAVRNDTMHRVDDDLQRDDILSRMHDSVLLRASAAQLAS